MDYTFDRLMNFLKFGHIDFLVEFEGEREIIKPHSIDVSDKSLNFGYYGDYYLVSGMNNFKAYPLLIPKENLFVENDKGITQFDLIYNSFVKPFDNLNEEKGFSKWKVLADFKFGIYSTMPFVLMDTLFLMKYDVYDWIPQKIAKSLYEFKNDEK